MQPELEETVFADFITSSPTTGAAIDADSTPTCEVFEDATDTAILSPTVTKRTGKTGNYRVPIACTAANGFETGKSYNAIVSATVGGIIAKSVLQTFQLRTNGPDDLAASILTRATPAQVQTELGTYGALKPTVATRTLDVSATGEAGVDWANIGAPTTAQNLSATTISATQAVASVANPVTLTAAYDAAKTAAAAGAAMTLTSGERTTVAGVIWNVLTSTLTTASTIGKLLVDNLDAKISTAVGDTPGTTTLLSRIASVLTITAGKVDVNDKTGFALIAAYDPAKTAVQAGAAMTLTAAYDAAKTAATQASVNAVDDFVDTEVGAIKTVTDKLDTALELDGPVWRYTVNALEQAPVGGGGGATDWTAPEREQIRHRLGLDGTATVPTSGIPSLASQASVNAIAAKTSNLPTDPADASDIAAAFTAVNGKLDAIDDFVDTEVAAIKAKTDQLNFTSGDVKATLDGETVVVSSITDKSGYSLTAAYDKAKTAAQPGEAMTLTPAYDAAKTAATQASVNVIDDFVDTEVNAIKAVIDKLDTTLESDGAVYRYTVNALEQAPVGTGGGGAGGETDWTAQERDQIRHRLGIDGAVAVPVAGIPSLASQVSSDAIKIVTDKLNTTLQPDGLVHQFTANALELAPAGSGNGDEPTQENPCAQNPAQTRGPTTEPYTVVFRA